MSFFAVLLALLIEQLKPLPQRNPVHAASAHWVGWVGRSLDAGKVRHAWIVWGLGVVAPALLATVVFQIVHAYSLILALLFDVLVLYLSLGFRQFSHHFTDIQEALDRGDEREARRLLAQWQQVDASELPRTELLRHVIEQSLLAAHRCVFGVFFWFVVLSAMGLGPAGAILYRMAHYAERHWEGTARTIDASAHDRLRTLSARLFDLIDHVPARLTAFGFAVVGNFEEAVNGWRRDASLWKSANEGVILAAAAGAVGVQLGGAPAPTSAGARGLTPEGEPDLGDYGADGSTAGAVPQLGHLQSMVGLVWRSVVLWMLLVALLSLANVVG